MRHTRTTAVTTRLREGVERLAPWAVRQLGRPRTRTAVIGLLLILIGALLISSPFWAFVLVVVGIVMVLTTWVGSRLEGRFAIEWSDGGAEFEMRARFKSASHAALGLPADPLTPPEADPRDAELIEGEAHTIDLNLDELKALIAAVEHNQTPSPTHQPTTTEGVLT